MIGEITRGKYRWSSESNVYLDEDGTGRPVEELEVAEGLMDEVDGWAQAVGWDTQDDPEEGDEYERPPSGTQGVPSGDLQKLEETGTEDTIVLATDPFKSDSEKTVTAGVKRKIPRQRGASRVAA